MPSNMAIISASGAEKAIIVCLLEGHCKTEYSSVSGTTKQIRNPDRLLPADVEKLASVKV